MASNKNPFNPQTGAGPILFFLLILFFIWLSSSGRLAAIQVAMGEVEAPVSTGGDTTTGAIQIGKNSPSILNNGASEIQPMNPGNFNVTPTGNTGAFGINNLGGVLPPNTDPTIYPLPPANGQAQSNFLPETLVTAGVTGLDLL